MHRPENPPFLKKKWLLDPRWMVETLADVPGRPRARLSCLFVREPNWLYHKSTIVSKSIFKKGNSAKPLHISRGTTSTIFLTILQVQTHAFNLLRVRDEYIYHFPGHTPCMLQSPNTCFFHDPRQVDPHFYSSFKGYNHSSHDRNHRGRPETSIYFYIFYLIQVRS